MKIIDSIDKGLGKAEELIAMILMIFMLIVVSIQILNQAFLHIKTITWTEEVSRIMLVWVLMIGSCIATRRGSHLAVSFVYDNLKGIVKLIVRILVLLICIFVTAYVCKSGIAMVMVQKRQGQFMGITGLPIWVASSAVPVCFAVMCFRFFLTLIREINETTNNRKGGEEKC